MPSPHRIIRRSLIGTAAAAMLYLGPLAAITHGVGARSGQQ